jgi:hypothetical protein
MRAISRKREKRRVHVFLKRETLIWSNSRQYISRLGAHNKSNELRNEARKNCDLNNRMFQEYVYINCFLSIAQLKRHICP